MIRSNYNLTDGIAESRLEEKMARILIDYEITNMVRSVKQQVWLLNKKYRADFVLDINGKNKLIIEVDGPHHFKTVQSVKYTVDRHNAIEKLGYVIMHVIYTELSKPEFVANRIQSVINALQE